MTEVKSNYLLNRQQYRQMQNQEIIKIIENLGGRRNYEEKKASKLGFNSLYAYFEDKILKQKKASEEEEEKLKTEQVQKSQKKKSCSCC